MRTETDELILRPLQKNETELGGSCNLSAEVFDFGGKEGCFAVVSKESRKIVGTVLCPEEEIRVYITKSNRDLGYGADALSLALDALFGVLGRKVVTAFCDKEDIPSVKTLEHCGFEKEEQGASLLWRITAEQWEVL
ncbi:MAG: GNAT family N-acetyltransferase [Firmicutes bacterium]|nr:GNAT family N-acetyltransferase [Bacillota bacterium]